MLLSLTIRHNLGRNQILSKGFRQIKLLRELLHNEILVYSFTMEITKFQTLFYSLTLLEKLFRNLRFVWGKEKKKGDIFIVSHEPDNLSVQEKHIKIYIQWNNCLQLKETND